MTTDFRRHFEEHAERYAERVAPLFAVTYERVLAWSAALPPATRVLDVACGDGRLAAAMAAQGHLVTACDRSKGLLSRVGDPRVRAVDADATALPFADRAFGAVVCNLGVQFFDAPVDALREMNRVVVASGPVLLTVPDGPPRAIAVADPAGPSIERLVAAAGLTLVSADRLEASARIADTGTLVAVWQVELGSWRELADASEEELAELAEVLLDRDEEVVVPLRFRAYHCASGG